MISSYHGLWVLIRKRDSSRISSLDIVLVLVEGRSEINSSKTSDFLNLALVNSK